jgi:hypothetical protein
MGAPGGNKRAGRKVLLAGAASLVAALLLGAALVDRGARGGLSGGKPAYMR